jgi:hypothetical protein
MYYYLNKNTPYVIALPTEMYTDWLNLLKFNNEYCIFRSIIVADLSCIYIYMVRILGGWYPPPPPKKTRTIKVHLRAGASGSPRGQVYRN